MKSSINQWLSKCCFSIGLLAVSLVGEAQQRSAAFHDPSLGAIRFTDMAGMQVNENFINPGQTLKLTLPLLNESLGKPIPAGSCKIKIGLGTKLQLDPTFDLSTVELSNYFRWSVSNSGGQAQLTGDLISPIPTGFREITLAFKIKGSTLGTSTITANFLVTNHHTDIVLSDRNGANNISSLKYAVSNSTAPLPVTVISDIKKKGCNIEVKFSAENQVNVVKYEIEASKDGALFNKVGEVVAGNLSGYTAGFALDPSIENRIIYVRIKTIFSNGTNMYSNTEKADGLCSKNWKADVYPNPVSNIGSVVIRATEGIFNGKYKVSMIDAAGRLMHAREYQFNNIISFNYELGSMASGKYLIKLESLGTKNVALLHFEKL